MRKLGIVALLIGLFVVSTVSVKALTEDGLKEKILGTIELGGDKYSLSNADKRIVETYLEQNDISDTDATYIGEKVDAAIAIIQGQGNANFTNYPQSVKDELKALVADVSANTSVKATLTKDGLTVKNQDGSDTVVTKLVKQTGYESSKTAIIVAISFLIVAVGAGLVIKQVKTGE